MQKLVSCVLLVTGVFSVASSYKYNFQNYPLHFDALYHGKPRNRGPPGHGGPMENQLIRSAMRSLLNPATGPGVRSGSRKDNFTKEWNKEFGYNFINIEAVQENVGCRARCRKMDENPVCGSNMTRYFNSCDAECDQVKYTTNNLRYNNACCCYDSEMTLEASKVYCVAERGWTKSSSVIPKMIINKCLFVCLEKNGNKIAQNNDKVYPC